LTERGPGGEVREVNMPLDTGLDLAWQELQNLSPYVVGAKSGADFKEGRFHLPFFNRTILIPMPRGKVTDDKSNPLPPWLELLILHYLVTADGTPEADQWITYRQLPGAALFESRFNNMAIRSLLQAFGNDLEGFHKAGEAMGGIPMSRTGDASFRFLALPQLPMAVILYLGDEEVSPSVNVLFDANAPHYLPTEDLSYLGVYLGMTMRNLQSGARHG
ncbi:MAG: hypothetical protein HW384_1499, partial [Dehalococcoidia bacterium]|nr:hypothetical protein [Dehalococcoidia bacterium]